MRAEQKLLQPNAPVHSIMNRLRIKGVGEQVLSSSASVGKSICRIDRASD